MMSLFCNNKIKAVIMACGLFLLGMMIVFLFFEIAFRVGGMVYRAKAYQRNAVALKQEGAVRVLCLGESTTEMGGEDSYPRQLERILNQQQQKFKFAVINGGIPGGNTDTIAQHLFENIKSYQPAIVVLMMGINDVASTVQVNGFVQLLEQSRLVKLFNSLWKARVKETDSAAVLFMGQKIPKDRPDDDQRLKMAVTLAAQGKSKEAILFYTELIGRYKKYGNWPTMWFYRQIGEIYKRDQDTQSLIMTIGIIIKATPRDAWAIDNVQLLCQDGHEKTLILKTLEQAISENSREPALHQLAGSCYAAHNQMDLADGEFKKAQQLRADAINPITRNNYRKVIDLLNKQDIQVVVVGYPLRSFAELRNILDDIEGADLAIEVDNEKIFKDALSQGRYEDYFIDRFAGDFGHSTPKGNHLLASNIAKAILKISKK